MSQSRLIGNLKFLRNKKGFTQAQLAEGIISVSYLSKIENGIVQPTDEIIGLLINRLGVNEDEVFNVEDILSLLTDCHRNLISGSNKREVEEIIATVHPEEMNKDFRIHILYTLILLRTSSDRLNIKKELDFYLEKSAQLMQEPLLKYFFFLLKGLLFYHEKQYKESYRAYQEASHYLTHNGNEWERADLLYQLGLCSSRNWKIIESIEYTNQALQIYQTLYFDKRCIECHILNGINYRKINKYTNAINSYKLAKTIAKRVDSDDLLSMIDQNLGNLYSQEGQHELALNHYFNSYRLKLNDSCVNNRLLTMLSIVKEYMDLGEEEKAAEFMDQAKEILDNPLHIIEEDHLIQAKVYELKLAKKVDQLTFYLSERAIPHYLENKHYDKVISYSTLLAHHYHTNRKYKSASETFQKTIEAYNQIYQIRG
ncbi:tetratricopeptide repeat protein [Bacillus carboniphilus]|uniref:Tetratricopeptide repeat protein n=1 Tax=Bacillus carboniphilus TaxID=86663 RepID=A0ABN0VTZ3_9BACI